MSIPFKLRRHAIITTVIFLFTLSLYPSSHGKKKSGYTALTRTHSPSARKLSQLIKKKKIAIPDVIDALLIGECDYEDLPLVDFLTLSISFDITPKETLSLSPFMWLVLNTQKKGALALLERMLDNPQVDVNQIQKEGYHILHLIAKKEPSLDSLNVLSLLIARGAHIDVIYRKSTNPMTPLCFALVHAINNDTVDDFRIIMCLLAHHASVCQDSGYWSPLHHVVRFAMTSKRCELIRLLISRGADIHCVDRSGFQPLHVAAKCASSTSSLEALKLLITLKADPNALTHAKKTPLMLSVEALENESPLDSMSLLLGLTDNLRQKDSTGKTAFSLALKGPNTGALDKIRDACLSRWPEFKKPTTCAICLDTLDTRVVMIPCGHHFHLDCLSQWKQDTCPLCRDSY